MGHPRVNSHDQIQGLQRRRRVGKICKLAAEVQQGEPVGDLGQLFCAVPLLQADELDALDRPTSGAKLAAGTERLKSQR